MRLSLTSKATLEKPQAATVGRERSDLLLQIIPKRSRTAASQTLVTYCAAAFAEATASPPRSNRTQSWHKSVKHFLLVPRERIRMRPVVFVRGQHDFSTVDFKCRKF